ncbi:TPM domain-containing protein [Novosphingobium malaysiense]|uniref:Membrane protein n=1 Tax=Novosphingobium malaysiense TaxID=1348853 RepID=A0A0B1ZRE8_9SPHN|nr:membrane protein [Novosphingobium malaysiense]KHK91823.1 membrane protein [Novosphingobium malaysiense]
MSAPTYLTQEDHARISDAVARAELQSAGEIVTILADRSDGYTDIQLAWSAAASLLVLGALVIAPDFYMGLYDQFFAGWGHEWTPRAILSLAAGLVALKFGAVFLLQFWQPLKFWLIPPPVKTARVHDRAIRAFKIGAERRTVGRTGVLIYLSMREHRAEIVADEAIATKVEPEVWGDAMAAMLGHVREGRIAEGMSVAVEKVGAIIAPHFPRADDDVNELPDRLIEV